MNLRVIVTSAEGSWVWREAAGCQQTRKSAGRRQERQEGLGTSEGARPVKSLPGSRSCRMVVSSAPLCWQGGFQVSAALCHFTVVALTLKAVIKIQA